MALMGRAFNQAQKFGTEMAIPDEVTRLTERDGIFHLELRMANRSAPAAHHRQRRAL